MEAPPVQYTTTRDGLSIAWAEIGEGPALLWCNGTPFSHVQESFSVFGAQFEAIVRSFRLVTFDARGSGMSERDVDAVSLETSLADAKAVIDAAKLDRFIAYADGGNILAVATCLRLALELPDRVTHVVMESPYTSMRELEDTPLGRTSATLAELDWNVYTQTLMRVLLGLDASSEVVIGLAGAVAGWVDPVVGVLYARVWETIDLGDMLPQVRQPTLVIRQEPYFVPARCCQRVAAKIPGAKFRQYSDPTYAMVAELIQSSSDLLQPSRRPSHPRHRCFAPCSSPTSSATPR
ncbi:MAG: alpha/beta hydrolase [Chloroflexota bacterium]|nr:alpha/beta hydrolase [Chloroflexota bacterium]